VAEVFNERPIALKLLVIDDNRQNLDLITTALEQEGVEILTLRLASTYFCASTTIVLLDLVMPKINGMELLERIVAADPGTDVILITAHYSPRSPPSRLSRRCLRLFNQTSQY